MPIDPPPSAWILPDPSLIPEDEEFVGFGADLEPGTLLNAYRIGIFPMPLPEQLAEHIEGAPIGWWSPNPRGVLPLDGLHISRSLRSSMRHFEIRIDTAFEEVIDACADPSRPHGWITQDIRSAYVQLHQLGWAHSVETWDTQNNFLVGGLYGVAVGGFFAAESKFHRKTDASKAAVVGLVEHMRMRGFQLLDVQWPTDHLRSLGVVDVPRNEYLQMVNNAMNLTSVEPF